MYLYCTCSTPKVEDIHKKWITFMIMFLMDLKNRGVLSYPSKDVIEICILTEKL